jgi:hypothetical protein
MPYVDRAGSRSKLRALAPTLTSLRDVKRLAAALAAAALLLVAAAGLSSLRVNDYCSLHAPTAQSEADTPGWSAHLVPWPPGRRCMFTTADGRASSLDFGDGSAFLLLLACGTLAVVRRTPYTWALLILLGLAGLVALETDFRLLVPAFFFGVPLALAATRSITATTTAAAVLFLGAIVLLATQSSAGWAVLLLLASFADRIFGSAEKRLVGYFNAPRPQS